MKASTNSLWSVLIITVMLVTTMIGCSDSISTNDERTTLDRLAAPSKVQFANLINVQPADSDDDEGEDDEGDEDDDDDENDEGQASAAYNTQLIMGLSEPVLTANRLLKRYGLMTGFRLLKRYDGAIEIPYGIVGEFADTEWDDIETEEEFEFALADILDELELDDDVQWVEPDILLLEPLITPSFELAEGQHTPWNIDYVGKASGNFDDVDLYLLDSGIYSEDLNVIEELDFVGDLESGGAKAHGYHIAGTLAAVDNNSGVVGIAPGARVHSFRVLDNYGATTTSTVVAALDEIISRKNANPAQPIVISMSFGGNTGSSDYTILDETVEAAVAAGIVVVIAAGNEGVDVATVTPAHAEAALTVGSFGASDAFSYFSNHGALIDILAPGEDILSLESAEGSGAIQLSSRSGTSMAAPHVAGVAVAYLQANPAATPAEVRAALISSASATISSVPTGTTNLAVQLN